MTRTPFRRVPSALVVPVLLRAAGLVGCWLALGALLYRAPTAAENGVNIGAGIARPAGVMLVVVLGAAVDARRRGFADSVRTWVAALGVLAVAALAAVVVPPLTGSASAAPLGTALVAVVVVVALLLLPAAALAVGAAALGDRLRPRPPVV